jgi:prepilin-type N-terminal cleavage/methylation domain-containing protein
VRPVSRGADTAPRFALIQDGTRGFTLIELLFVLAVSVIVTAAAIPQTIGAIDSIRAVAAARYLASRMAMARAHAVMRSANVALRFTEDTSGVSFAMFVDGNRDGVRTADIVMGLDNAIDSQVSLSELFPGVTIAVSGAAGSDPVRVGPTHLLSFTPLGTATSGSIYIRGREGSQFVVRVLGTTGRTRIQRYVAYRDAWVDTL